MTADRQNCDACRPGGAVYESATAFWNCPFCGGRVEPKNPLDDYALVVMALQSNGGEMSSVEILKLSGLKPGVGYGRVEPVNRRLKRALAEGLVEKAGRRGKSLLWRAT